MKTHAEIEYTNADGVTVHSDVCPPGCDFANVTPDVREFYHTLLDEYLDESRGTGEFYIREEKESESRKAILDQMIKVQSALNLAAECIKQKDDPGRYILAAKEFSLKLGNMLIEEGF